MKRTSLNMMAAMVALLGMVAGHEPTRTTYAKGKNRTHDRPGIGKVRKRPRKASGGQQRNRR